MVILKQNFVAFKPFFVLLFCLFCFVFLIDKTMTHFTDLCTESISLRDSWFWQPSYRSWSFNVNPISSEMLHVQARPDACTFKH